jgi:hypothetical protein
MKEQIKDLMVRAGFDPAAIERMGIMPQAEKFAELIVGEWSNEKPCSEGYDTNTVHHIKEYFGIGD